MSFPDVSDAFWGWTSPVVFKVIQTTVADFEVAEQPVNAVSFEAVLEPMDPRKLLVKPENQRNWKWWTLWSKFQLSNGQVVEDCEGLQYRVMTTSDWRNGGYIQYEAVQAPAVNVVPPVVPS